ncbi:hypothetical protein K431DRAFT_217730 [Polychaeton citri CBS 116435]|uniref:DNA repair protein Rhp26/Rad26 n=1 Tax=Polychaeton citri CBS 116435 TaxID=1314669 RepID=A0A9P4QDQ8_9PEZI|nr:hypothetical protein K431DRAFT_217730 [Polychaeton citri CBS 116435]
MAESDLEVASRGATPTVPQTDPLTGEQEEASQLVGLATGVRDQDDLERDIGRQADQLLLNQADERDGKRLEKTQRDRARLVGQIRQLDEKLLGIGGKPTKDKWRAQVANFKEQVGELDKDLEQIQKRIDERHKHEDEQDGQTLLQEAATQRGPGESQRDYLIRTGKITPFSKLGRQLLHASSSLGDVLLDAEDELDDAEDVDPEGTQQEAGPKSHRDLLAPGFETDATSGTATPITTDGDAELARRLQDEEFATDRPAKRRRLQIRRKAQVEQSDAGVDVDDFRPEDGSDDDWRSAKDDAVATDDSEGDALRTTTPPPKRKGRVNAASSKAKGENEAEQEDLAGIDDGNESVYQARLQSWVRRRRAARRRFHKHRASGQGIDGLEEWHMPHPTRIDTEFEGGFKIPGDIYPSLFDYQKTGVQWLWELHSQQVGGIIGDEMGLGKTIQAISFVAGLHYSNKLTQPIIIVCPATVMKQWVNEFHRWWPPLRVSILHTSGSGMLDVKREARIEDDLEEIKYRQRALPGRGGKGARKIVNRVVNEGHVLVTTYSGLQSYADLLIPVDWGYAVLDEGHKIRNPNTAITIYCKEIRTHNRIILSGTPMQNNLTELWSLFDFVFPMRLGTLVNFRNQFEIPIKQGGYANASNLQVETAMKCAETLKDTVSPYLLQRFKVDVAADLPKKSERVLFCKLTKLQRDAYQWFLGSEETRSILDGKRQALYGIDILRKICNHPDLVEHRALSKKAGYAYGTGAKSGKMQVVKALLQIWKKHGHKTLLFAQHRIMLDILESFLRSIGGFNYRRMDGSTNIKDRQNLVDEFNRDPDLHVFLLTTKVGGLGVNLTGANRVIIYDPDWNPSTDIQARERAWRLGQKKEVEIYRLMTAGTIEEKIYHRQIFKQFLTNKILRDPKQRQTFQLKDLHDLFTLGDAEDGTTETGSIFKGTELKLSGSSGAQNADKSAQGLPTPPTDIDGNVRKNSDGDGMSKIAGLSRQEEYRGNADEEREDGEKQTSGEDGSTRDDRILSSIFARNGVHSALEHDAIMGSKKTVTADPEIIAQEAKRVAAEAARELQRAGEIARTVPVGTPTWTGQFGVQGRPEERPSPSRRGGLAAGRGRGRGGGPSSTFVLANLQARQGGSSSVTARASPSSSRGSTPHGNQPKGKDFLVLIRDFLLAHDGSAPTQMLIDHFNRYCGSPQRTAEFKEMLKTIAELDRGSRGRSKWSLREEYRPSRLG